MKKVILFGILMNLFLSSSTFAKENKSGKGLALVNKAKSSKAIALVNKTKSKRGLALVD